MSQKVFLGVLIYMRDVVEKLKKQEKQMIKSEKSGLIYDQIFTFKCYCNSNIPYTLCHGKIIKKYREDLYKASMKYFEDAIKSSMEMCEFYDSQIEDLKNLKKEVEDFENSKQEK